ncbi:MAG: hypothetical protein ACFE9Q_03860 [Candidatus Hodarchaeota archaeon]
MKKRNIFFIIMILIVILLIPILFFTLNFYRISFIIYETNSISIDGGANDADAALGITYSEDGFLYVTGFITVPGQGKDIWLAKFDMDLNLEKNISINYFGNGDDIGYTLFLDNHGFLYLVGYVTNIGDNQDIFIGKFNCTDLSLTKAININGPDNSTDEGYGVLFDENNNIFYIAGTLTEPSEGYNIFISKLDLDLTILKSVSLNGPSNSTDKARFLVLDNNDHLYVSGSKSQEGSGYDLWFGKFFTNLTFIDEIIISSPTEGEDKGYGMVFDGYDTLYLTGTLNHSTQGFNIFLGKYDLDLNHIKNITINGPINGEDVAYTLVLQNNLLFQTGVYSEISGGSNIWIAAYNTNMVLKRFETVDGSANNYDTGYGIISKFGSTFLISGSITESLEGPNIWIGEYFMGETALI